MADVKQGDTINSMDEFDAGLAADVVEYATVEGFAPGKKFRIGSLKADDLIEWREANEGVAKRTAGLRLILRSIVNDKGERFMNDDKNIVKLRGVKVKITERIIREIVKLNDLKDKDDEAKKD
jgi:hypothetical protein